MFIGELSGRDEAILVLILLLKDVLHHLLMMGVVGRVTMTLKLLPQVLLHLVLGEFPVIVEVHFLEGFMRPGSIPDLHHLDVKSQGALWWDLTFPLLAVSEGGRYDEAPLLSSTHPLQTLVPSLYHLFNTQSEPDRLLVSLGVAGMKLSSILKISFMVYQQNVSVLGLAMTEERFVQNCDFYLGFWKFPSTDEH